jgi:hypothetical protein
MRYEAADFARCAGNPALEYCTTCKRWVVHAPLPHDSIRSVWIGVWVMEDEHCPSFVEMKEE